MTMIVLRLLSLLDLKSRLRPRTSRFFQGGGGVSLDSWTPGPKPLCHRHPTGPHPSGFQWTPANGAATRRDFALGFDLRGIAGHLDHRLLAADHAIDHAGEGRADQRRQPEQPE